MSKRAEQINVRSLSPVKLSAASGLIWALIALFIGYRAFGHRIWGGIVIAPFIGILIGRMSWPMRDTPRWVQIAASLFDLYVAAACFGVGMALFSPVLRPRNVNVSAVLIEQVLAVLWGLTFGGYVLVLWPLSYFNHRLVWRGDASRLPAPPKINTTRAAVRRLAVGIIAVAVMGFFASALLHAVVVIVASSASTRPWWVATDLIRVSNSFLRVHSVCDRDKSVARSQLGD